MRRHLRGASAPGRQTMVRGLRIACRNISVSLKDTGPRVAGSTEKDALRRSSTPWHGGPRHVRLRRSLNKKSRNQFKTILESWAAADAFIASRCFLTSP
jgi:hypothetical protein